MKNVKLILLLILMGFMTKGAYSQPSESSVVKSNQPFLIQSAMKYGIDKTAFWDLPGVSPQITNNMELSVFSLDAGADRKYSLVPAKQPGYYEIIPAGNSKMRLDVAGGNANMAKNGNKISTWSQHGNKSQQYLFKHLGEGKFKIYTRMGHAFCLAGRKADDQTPVVLWDDHDGPWMEWYLINPDTNQPFVPTEVQSAIPEEAANLEESKPVIIQSAMKYGIDKKAFWDLPGVSSSITKNMDLQVYGLDAGADRKFSLVASRQPGYYEIVPGGDSSMRLDVKGGNSKIAENGAQLSTWGRNGNFSQNFLFKHLGGGKYKIYSPLGHAVCLSGRSADDDNSVVLWDDHDGPWLEWYLIDPATQEPILPTE